MGYRYKLNKYPKTFINQLSDLKTFNKRREWLQKFFPNYDLDDPIDHMCGTQIFDIGETLPNGEEIIKKYGDSVASSIILQNYCNDYEFLVLDKDGFDLLLDGYRTLISSYYGELLSDCENSKETPAEIKLLLSRRKDLWFDAAHPERKPYNTDNEHPMVRSNDYQDEIWELVRLYREFDWDNYTLVLTGW